MVKSVVVLCLLVTGCYSHKVSTRIPSGGKEKEVVRDETETKLTPIVKKEDNYNIELPLRYSTLWCHGR